MSNYDKKQSDNIWNWQLKKGAAREKKGKSMPFQAKSKAIVHCTLGYKYSNFFTEWTFCKGMAWFFCNVSGVSLLSGIVH